MKHISWVLVVLMLATGCGRDKKAWAHKIDALVQRANACKDVACAKAVDEEMGKIVGGDEGQKLDKGEPEFMFQSAELIRNRVAELEDEARTAKARASSPLSGSQVFEATLQACVLAYSDLHDPVRARVEETLAKVGAKLPEDIAPGAKASGGLFWHEEFVRVFLEAMGKKVPDADALYAPMVHDLCILNFRYDAANAAKPDYYGPTIDHLEKVSDAIGHKDQTKDLIAAARRAAPTDEVIKACGTTIKAIRAAISKPEK